MRRGFRGSPAIGSLDSEIPLLAECLPALKKVEFMEIETLAFPLERVDVGEYSLLPVSKGVDNPVFSTKPVVSDAKNTDGGNKFEPFSMSEMLSVDAFRKIKEIMQ